MRLEEILSERRSTICNKWFDRVIRTYPEDTAVFLKSKKNRFANPVGYILFQELEALLNGLIQGVETAALRPNLDNIVRIRAVQDFTASQAVNFILLLKDVVREELEEEIREHLLGRAFLDWESRVDALTLLAFDLFMECREKIYDLKANELNRRTLGLLRRAGLVVEEGPERPS